MHAMNYFQIVEKIHTRLFNSAVHVQNIQSTLSID